MIFLNTSIVSDSLLVKSEKVAHMIQEGRFDDLLGKFLTWGIEFLAKLIIAIVIFFIGRWLIGIIRRSSDKVMQKREMEPALRSFLKNVLDTILYIALIILIINVVGKNTVSIAALIGSAGLAVGLAVKDNLANFAGGVMLLFNKPFKSSDFIEAQNLSGTVQSIGVLYTTLITFDNKTIHIPNGPLSTGNIVNYSTQPTRRVDIVASIEYGTDTQVVKDMLLDIANAHPLVLKTPEPFARMTQMNEHSLDFTLRVWTEQANFWTVTHDLNEEVYRQINERGLVVPFHQLTVHLSQPEEQAAQQIKK